MEVEIRFFAQIQEIVGSDRLRLELPPVPCIGTLREVLIQTIPALAPWKKVLLFALNAQYADDTAPIPPGAQIACFPPVGGG